LKLLPAKKMKPLLRIAQGSDLLVQVWPNGWVEYGPAYDPDVAAQAFWEAMARNFPLAPKEVS